MISADTLLLGLRWGIASDFLAFSLIAVVIKIKKLPHTKFPGMFVFYLTMFHMPSSNDQSVATIRPKAKHEYRAIAILHCTYVNRSHI
jgi:hypothetical protein